MQGLRHPERLFIAQGVMFDAATWSFYLAAIVWWTVTLGYGPVQLVLLGTVLEVTALVCEVPTGVMADRFSRKWSVVTAFAIMAGAMVLAAVTTNFGVHLVAQGLWGLGWTFKSGADVAWLTDERTALRRSTGEATAEALDESPVILRRHRLGFVGGIAALLLVAAFGSQNEPGVIIVSGLALGVATIGLAFAMTDTYRTTRTEGGDGASTPSTREILRDGLRVSRRVRPVRILLIAMVLLGLGGDVLDRLGYKQFLDEGDFGNDSLLFTTVLFLVLAVVGLIGISTVERLSKAGRNLAGLMVALLVIAAAGAGVAALAPALGIAVGLGMQDAAREAFDPVSTAYANSHAPEASRATVLSFVGLAHGVGEAVGGIALAALAEATSIRVAILVTAALWGTAALVSRTGERTSSEFDVEPLASTTLGPDV